MSCQKWDKEEAIPSYIRIVNANISTNYSTQGSNSCKIADIWVNIDGNRQGTYEIPTLFPVLATGKHNITLRAGIKVNGISASRIIYPFYNVLNIDTILPEGNILTLSPIFTYKTETVFGWKEDFQGNGFSLDRDAESDTLLYTISDSVGNKVGKFSIDAIRQRFYYKSADAFTLPKNGTAIFLEFDYRCNHPFSVGLIINKLQSSIVTPVLILNPHPNTFNHIYVDFSYIVNQNVDAIDFNVIFQCNIQEGYTQGDIEIDNIKLLHF